ncbi:enoyl CoA hydratase domain-containing protein 1 [Actinomortierella ambigua]|uniref:Enoyl CoA hydratase domain-containing protein 1 n=1 Tax=Actinomortierella ambigua TaxID=1343610 RepID=A0A9P6QA94_9FUNG|nr:enoyl CoA hydratase domain-containing protein 1 [Actinomortierella ambigua]
MTHGLGFSIRPRLMWTRLAQSPGTFTRHAMATAAARNRTVHLISTAAIRTRHGHAMPSFMSTSQQNQQQQKQQRQKYQQTRSLACQVPKYTTKLDAIRGRLRQFGTGHIEIELNHSPGIALLTLHNPAKHNALTGKMMAELADWVDLLETVYNSPRLRGKRGTTDLAAQDLRELLNVESKIVLKIQGETLPHLTAQALDLLQDMVGIVVTGSENKSYCAGLDLSAAKETLSTPQAGGEMTALMVSTLTRFMRLPILSIAAIERAAVGGGAEMTTFCDHRCLTTHAKVQFVQTLMGVVTGWGGTSRLINLVPRSDALRLLAGAVPIQGGEEAVQLGFAQTVAPTGKAVEVATQYLDQYVWEIPPPKETGDGDEVMPKRRCLEAVRAFKRLVSYGVDDERVDRVAELEKDLFRGLWGGPDNLARVEAASANMKRPKK